MQFGWRPLHEAVIEEDGNKRSADSLCGRCIVQTIGGMASLPRSRVRDRPTQASLSHACGSGASGLTAGRVMMATTRWPAGAQPPEQGSGTGEQMAAQGAGNRYRHRGPEATISTRPRHQRRPSLESKSASKTAELQRTDCPEHTSHAPCRSRWTATARASRRRRPPAS